MATLLLGTLVQNGKRNQFPTAYSGGDFGLADADSAQQIAWLVTGGTLFCCHNLLTASAGRRWPSIPWSLAAEQKSMGSSSSAAFLSPAKRPAESGMRPWIWYRETTGFSIGRNFGPGARAVGLSAGTRVVRGGGMAKEWQSYPENAYACWRPVLEPKGVPIPQTGLRLQAGYELLVWDDNCVVRGKFLDESDYDLVLQSSGTWFADAGVLFQPLEKKIRTIAVDKSQVRIVQIGRYIGS